MRRKQRRVLFCLALACGTTTLFASAPSRLHEFGDRGGAAPRHGDAWSVGRLETVSIRTTHPYPSDAVAGVWTRVLTDPGASYLRIHFKSFDLAEGDWLEIAGVNGAEPRRYIGRGPVANDAFWAFTVAGDKAVLTLHASSGGRHGFEIDAYGRGIEPILGAIGQPPSAKQDLVASSNPGSQEPDPTGLVCGALDWSDVACYATSRPVEAQHARAAVLAIEGCCTAYTAFKVSDGGQFMTSYRASVEDVELWLDYQTADCDGNSPTDFRKIRGGAVLQANPVLDFTLFTTIGDSSTIPCLQLDRRQPALGERVYIPQHPWGGVKKIAIWSDLDVGGFCAVDPIPSGNGLLVPPANEIGYFCDTSEGSLGAPVLSGATHRVVGINHVGRCPNSASRMDRIWPQIADLADTCSNGYACQPVGGGRCDCNGACSIKEQRYTERGGLCADCWEEPGP